MPERVKNFQPNCAKLRCERRTRMVRDEEDDDEDAAGAQQHDGGEAVVGQTSASALVEEFADGGECRRCGIGVRRLRQEPGWPRTSPAQGVMIRVLVRSSCGWRTQSVFLEVRALRGGLYSPSGILCGE